MTGWRAAAAVVLLALVGGAGPAEALPAARTVELHTVAELSHAPNLSLCHKVETRRIGMVPLRRVSIGYVLSVRGCGWDWSWALPRPVSALRDVGYLPADLPDAPHLTWDQALRGHLALILLAGFALHAVGAAARRRRARAARVALLGLGDGPAFRMIDAMCHAAARDGRGDAVEIAHIRDLAGELSGLHLADAQIEAAMARTLPVTKPADAVALGTGLTSCQREIVLEGMLSVLLVEGGLRDCDRRLYDDLVAGIALPVRRACAAKNRVLRRRAAAAPG